MTKTNEDGTEIWRVGISIEMQEKRKKNLAKVKQEKRQIKAHKKSEKGSPMRNGTILHESFDSGKKWKKEDRREGYKELLKA